MNDSTYIIRSYQPADFNKCLLLCIEAEKLEPTGRYTSLVGFTEYLNRPNYSPEQDFFVVEISGDIVGYMDVTPELVIRRVILDCWVHPRHRRHGLATKLFNYAERRAREPGVKVVHVRIPEGNTVAREVVCRLGFKQVRTFLELKLSITDAHRQDIKAPGCRYLKRSEEEKLALIQNRSFSGSWGYNPNTLAEIIYRANLSNFSPEDVILACDGDRVIGYCWTEVVPEMEAVAGKGKGRIYMIGVDPDYRGSGVGRRVLLAGLAHLRKRGLRVCELTVDAENEAANELYQSVGFEIQSTTLWYEKVID